MTLAGLELLQAAGLLLATVAIAGLATWAAIALRFQAPGGTALRRVWVLLWCLFALCVLVALNRDYVLSAAVTFALAFGALQLWWHSLKPSNYRDWADDVAHITTGSVAGDVATLVNVRNFAWRSNHDYTQRWETRSYDLRRLASVDMIMSYWNMRPIAHALFSFGFDDGEYLAFSVEIRRERTEVYSPLGGFFKEFELTIVAADERDIVRVRTNIRGEDDYLYRLRLSHAQIRSLFCAYLAQANALAVTPRFYNTVTVNCTTLVYQMVQHIVGRLPFSLRVVFSGYLPEYVYSIGGLDVRYSLEELRTRGRITQRAQAAGESRDFSAEIRSGIPVLAAPGARPIGVS
jgi:hypothetical protein